MFGIFKASKKNAQTRESGQTDSTSNSSDPATESLMRAIAEQKKNDPMAGLKIGAIEINERFLKAMKNEKGVHIESLLTALAALAGFSCQMAIREEFIKTGKATEREALTEIKTKDGHIYYFGDNLNKPLAENKLSVWALVGGELQGLGAKLPDITDIFSHIANTVGSKEFGRPRVDEKHKASDTPENYVRDLWPVTLPIIEQFCDRPMEWPILLSLSLQKIINLGKDVIPPETAGTLVMETAISMSKINPESVNISK
ncbi:MAG: hypothetical protein KDJ75_05590 [Alphaproteobacteria bacterium]|nr:hypothetical protein [Alphaproteobacteria bacterium]